MPLSGAMAFFDNSYKRSDLAKQWWEQHVAAMNYRRTQETANFLPSLSPRSQALAPMGSPRAISSLTPRRRAGKLASVSPRSAYPPMADSAFFPQRTQKAPSAQSLRGCSGSLQITVCRLPRRIPEALGWSGSVPLLLA